MSALDSGDPRQRLDPPASSSVSCVFRRVGVQVHMLNVEIVAMLHDFHDIREEKRQTDSADRQCRQTLSFFIPRWERETDGGHY